MRIVQPETLTARSLPVAGSRVRGPLPASTRQPPPPPPQPLGARRRWHAAVPDTTRLGHVAWVLSWDDGAVGEMGGVRGRGLKGILKR